MTLITNIAEILETIVLCIAIYYLVRGIKTKNFGNAGIFLAVYLLLVFLQRFL